MAAAVYWTTSSYSATLAEMSRPRREPRGPATVPPRARANTSDKTGTQVATIRDFNRFYTRQIGVLNREFLDTPYSLAEVRVLYELYHQDKTTATAIGQELALDAGYLSRILRGFHRRGLLAREASSTDVRQTLLRLSASGRRVFEAIEARQRAARAKMLQRRATQDREQLVRAMP